MPSLYDLIYSYHVQNDRAERKERIDAVTAGNYGKIIRYARTTTRCIKYLTSNGLIFVVDDNYVVTFYLARKDQIKAFYPNEKVPARMYERVEKNIKIYNRIYDDTLSYDHFLD